MDSAVNQLLNPTNSISLYGIGLILALAGMAYAVLRIRAWYRDGDDPADTQREMLRQFRESTLRGDLSDEEFRSIKGQMNRRENRR